MTERGEPPPALRGRQVMLRLVDEGDRARLLEILDEPEVARWWGASAAATVVDELLDPSLQTTYAIEAAGEVVGSIQFVEESDPNYRHAGIDIFVSSAHQGRGVGSDAIRTLGRHLLEERGHHRLTIDPAVANERAIQVYRRIGFRPVGVMRAYERGPDGSFHDGLLMDLVAGELAP